MTDAIPIANAAATWSMVGVIWLIQLLVYPSFRDIESGRFREAMLRHQTLTGRIVILPMLIELVTSLLLLIFDPNSLSAWLSVICVGVWGFSTVLVQVPIHTRLAESGPDAALIDRLVKWNWPRTIAWTAHGVIVATRF